MNAPCQGSGCSHSISGRLSTKLALFTMLVLSILFALTWQGVGMMIRERNAQDLLQRCQQLSKIIGFEAQNGGAAGVRRKLQSTVGMRLQSRLQVWSADGTPFYADDSAAMPTALHQRTEQFRIDTPELPGGYLMASYSVDFSRDVAIGRRWAALLVLATLAAGAVVAVGGRWRVQRELRPLNDLAAQTRAISPRQLNQRLVLRDPAEELQPWVTQFNGLMGRLEQSYAQLEGFNADVAHELRTPLATIIGQTELALSRDRTVESLRDTLVSNLEETQRLSALVNDMLFLSQADRGASARCGPPTSLADLCAQVLDFHEATLDAAQLTLHIEGDAHMAVDEALVKRALSNLLGNATRFAQPGSTLLLQIARETASLASPVRMLVQNQGPAIAAEHLPRLFDRFFRADAARCCDDGPHHGLGLAIVAAIARMHGGQTFAESAEGVTRVGFSLGAGPAAP
jgi:two-component system, OmpR family, heavy metal sensor histidine kinase CusS